MRKSNKGRPLSPQTGPGICKRFRQVRLRGSLTQAEFGESLGISASSVKAIERGIYQPTLTVIKALKRKYKLSYEWIIDGKG